MEKIIKNKIIISLFVVLMTIGNLSMTTFAATDDIDEIFYVHKNNFCVVSNANTTCPIYHVYKHNRKTKKWINYIKRPDYSGWDVTKTNSAPLLDKVNLKYITVKTMKSKNKKLVFYIKKLPKNVDRYKVIISKDQKFKNIICDKNFKGTAKKFTFKEVEVGPAYYFKVITYSKDANNNYIPTYETKTKLLVLE